MNKRLTPKIDAACKRDLRQYTIGYVLAMILSLAAFVIVWQGLVAGLTALAVLSVLATVQIVVHFHYFLHIGLEKSHRDDLYLILFTVLIVALMVAGTIWILYDQHSRM
ncbi:cytochrome o ubiquinol oxidase subunit IV [Rhodalgimonas zhirmunskyi]|uniref:Cytochrome bo(3) ubiquinol oxidase subunit 4 n=1 Tax=Rhodalgimonas zhirmunskyi TaxID=2964767 RepID=A0AAJ1U8C8_9RHOB|nr:cytochrome o ubiquinol oxidase subunit IV [Rhodoalgimonas zhirmunskyi]MDQ2093645.1 cytochrome o ubiquinol oxidase subunit IV [Rhodoalgimonas zhirmunskyi]